MRSWSAPSPALLPCLLLIGSCSAPPKPPTVDESTRRPANSITAVELQTCRNDLHNSRILAAESQRTAASTAASLQRLSALQQVMVASQSDASAPRPNSVFTVRFDYGDVHLGIPPELSAALIEEARQAPLVVLRGRTDGTSDSPGESRIARERATAVRDYLLASGVDGARMRVTYQPAGDHAADNSLPAGRAMNRRVEIEVYRIAPVTTGVAAATAARSPSTQR